MIVFGPLWFVVVVMAIYFVLRIAVVSRNSGPQPTEAFDPNRFNTVPLPKRTVTELKAHVDALRTEWVTYNGRTPPLRLKLRGNSYEDFRRRSQNYIDRIGQDHFERLSDAQLMQFLLPVIAEAYVVEWEGAQYQNGAPMPYCPDNLALFMAGDQHLMAFVKQEAERISPPWPTR